MHDLPASTPFQIGQGRLSFPFRGLGDVYARVSERDVKCRARDFVPIEATRTSYSNLLIGGAEFENAAWTANEVTVNDGQYPNPMDGLATMATLLETSASAQHYITQAVSVAGGGVWHCFSAIVQGIGRDNIWLRMVADSQGAAYSFNLQTGEFSPRGNVGSGFSIVPGIRALGGGLFRIWLAANVGGSATVRIGTSDAISGSLTFTGDPTKGVIVWAAQLEQARTPGPVIITTSASRTILAPPVGFITHPADSMADIFSYLVGETDPTPAVADTVRWTRRYARIPATQYDFTTRWISKPEVPESTELVTNVSRYAAANGERTAVGVGALYLRQSSDRNYLWSPTSEFFGPATISAVAFARVNVTGGTFTVTYKGQTTAALAYNETGANIATAINALSTVLADGFVVTVTNSFTSGLGLQIARSSGANIPAEFSLGAASLTPASAAIHFLSYTALNTQVFRAAYVGTLASHGYVDTAPLLTYQESTDRGVRVYPVGRWAVIDANTIAVDRDLSQSIGTNYFVAPYLRDYAPGNIRATLRVVSNFYLPGVTAGIADDDDIPLPVSREDTNAFLEALLANVAGYQDYSGDDRVRWLGPIRRQDALQLDFSTL